MIDAGQRDKLIRFVRPVTTTNDHGDQEEGVPNYIAEAWARVRYGTGQERREAAQRQATVTATFECNWTPTLAAVIETDKISFDSATWDIASRALVGQNSEIHFTAIRAD